MSEYELTSGQLNIRVGGDFNNHICVVIRDGKIYNLTDDVREVILDLFAKKPDDEDLGFNLEDMF